MHSDPGVKENGTGNNLDFCQSGSKDCPNARKGLPKRSQRINDTLACSLHFSVILQGLEDERYRAYLLSTNLIAINNKQDSVQNRDLPDTNYLTR